MCSSISVRRSFSFVCESVGTPSVSVTSVTVCTCFVVDNLSFTVEPSGFLYSLSLASFTNLVPPSTVLCVITGSFLAPCKGTVAEDTCTGGSFNSGFVMIRGP